MLDIAAILLLAALAALPFIVIIAVLSLRRDLQPLIGAVVDLLDRARRPADYEPPPAVAVPDFVERFILQESESWAQLDMRRRALELYADLEDWTSVLQVLLRDYGVMNMAEGELSG